MFRKPISISFSPNFQRDDVSLAWRLLLGATPTGQINQAPQRLKKHIEKLFPKRKAFLFSSGRAALEHALRAFDFKKGDEVLVQAFTCVAVPNAVIAAGLVPVFVDADNSYNISFDDLVIKTGALTKAIIIQHTFGIPANLDKIIAFAKSRGIVVVEDCAHALGGSFGGKPLGGWGDVTILSFGRDKVVSSVFGGAALSSNPTIIGGLQRQEKKLVLAPMFFTTQQLLYVLIYAIALPLYGLFFGKLLLRAARAVGLLSPAVFSIEKNGKAPPFVNYVFPEKLCLLALHQLLKLERFSIHRKKISSIYIKGLKLPLLPRPYLRVPYTVQNKQHFLKKAQRQNIHLGNWYRGPIDPPETNMHQFRYAGCPRAEMLAKHTVNLPTNINTSSKDAQKVVQLIKKYHARFKS